MITPTGATVADYWSAIKNGNKTHARMTFTGQNVVLEDEDIYLSTGIQISDILNGDTDLVFGKAVSKQVRTGILHKENIQRTISNASNSISFYAVNQPIDDLKIKIDPIQDLHGFSSSWIGGAGKNLFDPNNLTVLYKPSWTGDPTTSEDGTGIVVNATSDVRNAPSVMLDVFEITSAHIGKRYSMSYELSDSVDSIIGIAIVKTNGSGANRGKSYQITANDVGRHLVLQFAGKKVANSGVVYTHVQLEEGTATDWSPYENICPISGITGLNITHEVQGNSTEYEFSWQSSAGTVYGGTLNVLTGVLTVTHGQIASYNGEILPGEWLSDRDVYASGTSPTTGAQVVYELATPLTYQLTAQQISSLTGINTLNIDAGTIQDLTYYEQVDKLAGLNWSGEFTLEFGVEISGTTNWVTVGTFAGKKPNNVTSSEVVDFTAYDRMRLFDALADDYVSAISYPVTLQDIYDDLCTFVGIQNESGDELSNIMNRSFASAPADMQGYTCRDLLAWIAEACGCYAKITPEGKCKMVWFSDQTSYAISENEEFHAESVDTSDGVPAIDQVMIKQLDSDMDILYPDNITPTSVYLIVSNPFLAISEAQDITDYVIPIHTRLDGFGSYLPVKADCIGNWLVESGDIITVDVKGTDLEVPIFSKDFHWAGSVNDSYEATGSGKREAVSDKNKEKILNANEIKLIVKGNYYEKENGVVIDQNGVAISGQKNVTLESGVSKLQLSPTRMYFTGSSYAIFETEIGHNININGIGHSYRRNAFNQYIYDITASDGDTADTVLDISASLGGVYLRSYDNFVFYPNHQSNSGLRITVLSGDILIYGDNGIRLGDTNAAYGRIDYIYVQNLDYVNIHGSSSREIKHDIKKLESVGEKFDKLEPVTFVYNEDPEQKQRMGLIYEDTVKVMPEICSEYDGNKAISYVELIPALLKEIQELRARVKALEERQ